MKIRKNILGAVTLGLSLLALPAAAEDLPVGIVQSKNLVQRNLTIDDQVFKVTAQTKIYDVAGRPIRLEQVLTAEEQGALVEIDRVTYAYEAAGSVMVQMRAAAVPR